MLVKRTYKRNRTFSKESSQSQLTQRKNFRKHNRKMEYDTCDQEEFINELPVPDVIDYNLNVLFVGLFSGKKSIKERHHYSSSNNHFYYVLYESGMTNGDRLTYLDDQRLARDYKIGIVTLVSRPEHRSKTKLSVEEIRKGFPNLLEKVEKYRPKILCFNGKAVFQAFANFQNTRIHSSIKDKEIVTEDWGDQGDQPNFSIQWSDHSGCTKVFWVMSTSGRVAQYKKQRKVNHFKQLKELIYNDEDEDGNEKYTKGEERHVLDVKMTKERVDLINAYVKEALNNGKEDYKVKYSSLNKKRKREQDNSQDYSPPKSFIAKRW